MKMDVKINSSQIHDAHVRRQLRFAIHNKLSPLDLKVWVSGSHVFKMHKDLFMMASPDFDYLLGDAMEKNDCPPYTVKLIIDKDVFRYIKRYLYNCELPKDMEDLLNVLEASFQYNVDQLQKDVIDRIHKSIEPKDALKVLQTTKALGLTELEELALQIIYRNAQEILNDEHFTSLGCWEICRILESDALYCSEETVYYAAVRWAQEQARQKNQDYPANFVKASKYYFSQVVMYIRFPLIAPAEFAKLTIDSDIHDEKEIVRICQCICSPEHLKGSFGYNAAPRLYLPVISKITTTETSTQTFVETDNFLKTSPPVANVNARKRPASGGEEKNDLSLPGTPTGAVAAKVQRVVQKQEVNYDSDEDLFITVKLKKIENRTYPSYEEAVRRCVKDANSNSWTGFQICNDLILENNNRHVVLPNCDSLKVDVQCKFFQKSEDPKFLEFISHFDPMRYIFVSTNPKVPLTAEIIWSLNLDILLKFNGVTFLKVNHTKVNDSQRNDCLVLNYVSDSVRIIKNSKPNVLAVSNCEFNVKLFKERIKVEKLILYRVWGEYTLDEIVKDCPNLNELVCWKYVPSSWSKGSNFLAPLSLNVVNIKQNLRKLVLFQTELKFPLRCSSYATRITELVLDHCHSVVVERSAHISDVFHQVFPVLEALVITEDAFSGNDKIAQTGNLAIPSLINSVRTNIETIQRIMVVFMKWSESGSEQEMKDGQTLANFLRDEPNIGGRPQTFHIWKVGMQWEGRSMDDKAHESTEVDGGFWSDRDEMEYRWYSLNHFYDSCERFEDYFVQNNQIFPKPILWV